MLKKDVITEENIICNVSANCKNASKRFQKVEKIRKSILNVILKMI